MAAAGEQVADSISAVLTGESVTSSSGVTDKYAGKTAAEVCAEVAASNYGMAFQGWNSANNGGVSGLTHSPGVAMGYGAPQFGVPLANNQAKPNFGSESQLVVQQNN